MTRHAALIVEDEPAIAEWLKEILRSLDCEVTAVDNRREAIALIETQTFCIVLLDLEIKNEPDSLRGSEEGGPSVLREIRKLHSDRVGLAWRLPVVIVSAHVGDSDLVVEMMRQGASHAIHKSQLSRRLAEVVQRVLHESGRSTHGSCNVSQTPAQAPGEKMVLSIPVEVGTRGVVVRFGGRRVTLSDAPFVLLLRLVEARLKGEWVEAGYKSVSVLRNLLKGESQTEDPLIENEHGNARYRLSNTILLGPVDTENLLKSRDGRIQPLAASIADLLQAQR